MVLSQSWHHLPLFLGYDPSSLSCSDTPPSTLKPGDIMKKINIVLIIGISLAVLLVVISFYSGYWIDGNTIYKPVYYQCGSWNINETLHDTEGNTIYIAQPEHPCYISGFAMCSVFGRAMVLKFNSSINYFHEYYHMNYCSFDETAAQNYAIEKYVKNPTWEELGIT